MQRGGIFCGQSVRKCDGQTYDGAGVEQLCALLTKLFHVVKLQLRKLLSEIVDITESRLSARLGRTLLDALTSEEVDTAAAPLTCL